MAEIEYKSLVSIDTGEAISTIGELRKNIKALKKALDETDVGSQE